MMTPEFCHIGIIGLDYPFFTMGAQLGHKNQKFIALYLSTHLLWVKKTNTALETEYSIKRRDIPELTG